jgi:hypothetical protein
LRDAEVCIPQYLATTKAPKYLKLWFLKEKKAYGAEIRV